MPDLCVLRELELGVAGADQWLACDDRCGRGLAHGMKATRMYVNTILYRLYLSHQVVAVDQMDHVGDDAKAGALGCLRHHPARTTCGKHGKHM